MTTDTGRAGNVEKSLFAAAIFLIALAAYMQYGAGDAGDKGWLLLAARMWLSGKRLYVDIFETNLPLIVWLYSLPVWLSLHLGMQDSQLLALLTLLAAGCSVALCDRLLRFHPAFAHDARKRAWHAILLALTFVFWTNISAFGDREHLFLVFAFPYLLRCSPSLTRAALPLSLRLAIACMGAVGFCIKPHCALIFLGVQALTLWRERSLRMLWNLENGIICAGGAAYLLLVWLLAPEFFFNVLPMEWVSYGAYSMGAARIMFFLPSLLILGVAFVDFRPRDVSPYRKDILYFLGICVFLLLYVFANNGWGYTFYPLNSMALFAVAWLWWEFRWLKREATARGTLTRRLSQGGYACAMVLGANILLTMLPYAIVYSGGMPMPRKQNIAADLLDVMKENHFDTFGGLSPSFKIWPVLARNAGAQMETRYHHLWMMPSFVLGNEAFIRKQAWVPAYVATTLAEDMDRNKPEVMFVDTSPEFFSTRKPLDLIAYFSSTPAFKEAWNHYAWMKRVSHCEDEGPNGKKVEQFQCRYDVFRRVR